jgi:LPXTG-motif cell wall-anchored protein
MNYGNLTSLSQQIPATGDNSHIGVWIAVVIIAIVLVIVTTIISKKKK